MKRVYSPFQLLNRCKFTQQQITPLKLIRRENSFRCFHSNFKTFNQEQTTNDQDRKLVDEITKHIHEQKYWKAKQALRGHTKNWLGFYKVDENHLALYLNGLVLLESANDENKILSPLILASNNGYKKAQMMLAVLAYLKDSSMENMNYRTYLKEYDSSIDWSDEETVKTNIEAYLKGLIQEFDLRFAHFALGKIYMKNQKYRNAFESFTKSTEKNYGKAQFELGLLMRNGSPDGIISKNPERALELFKKSRFEPQSNKELVEMYLNGEGTNPSYLKAAFQTILYYLVAFVNSRFFMVLLICMEVLLGLAEAVLSVALGILSIFSFVSL